MRALDRLSWMHFATHDLLYPSNHNIQEGTIVFISQMRIMRSERLGDLSKCHTAKERQSQPALNSVKRSLNIKVRGLGRKKGAGRAEESRGIGDKSGVLLLSGVGS